MPVVVLKFIKIMLKTFLMHSLLLMLRKRSNFFSWKYKCLEINENIFVENYNICLKSYCGREWFKNNTYDHAILFLYFIIL